MQRNTPLFTREGDPIDLITFMHDLGQEGLNGRARMKFRREARRQLWQNEEMDLSSPMKARSQHPISL